MVIEATPAGLYVRDDKAGGQIWAAYETNYMPPKVKDISKFEAMGLYDPSSNLTKEQQFEMYKEVSASDDKDVLSKTKRIVYMPIRTETETTDFRTAMKMGKTEFDRLIDDLGGSTMSQAQWNAKWATLSSGESMVGLDGITYVK